MKFLFPKESARHRLDLYLIKNYYELKDYARAVDISNDFLGKHSKSGSSPSTREAGYYLTLSLLAQGKDEQAGKTWNIHVRQRSIDRFPTMRDIPDRVDPEKARLYSKMVPGSGLLLSGEYGKAAVSFLINLVFIAGSYRYFVGKQYGTAGLLFFFEIGWYHGGQNASHEAAVRYNERSTRQYRKDWLRSRMPPTGM
ncbi:MAG: hypothetical protein GY866_12890 [Proteobacteria bacterium]|nr:hypothetical protein [Pseudomonadota bacterium]